MKIKLQNPHTGQSIELDMLETDTVRDLAARVTTELNLQQAPQFFTYFSEEKAQALSSRTIVEGERVMLPDDLTMQQIVSSLRDAILPIYFQSQQIDEEHLFKFRTDRISRAGYDINALNSKKVMLGGVGLLGNEIAQNLALLGIGELCVMDYGYVDWYNIYRQPLFAKEDVYQSKVDVVSKKLTSMGKIKMEPVRIEIPCLATTPEKDSIFKRLEEINSRVSKSDVVVGALDIFSGRSVLQILSRFNKKPFVSSAVDAWGGKVGIYLPDENNCYCCGFHPGQFMDGGACTLATIEAQKIIVAVTTKFIVDCLLRRKFAFNEIRYYSDKMELKTSKVVGTPKCGVCGEQGLKTGSKQEVFNFIYDWLFRGGT